MARRNHMYERMYTQLVKECNEIADSMKVKIIVVPDTLTMDNFKELASRINAAMEKLTTDENAKLPTEFRKIYPKLADSLAVLENRTSIVERDIADKAAFDKIENFEIAVTEMLNKKAVLKAAAEQAKKDAEKQPENVPENQPENTPENAGENQPENTPENAGENQPENAGYTDTDIASEGKQPATPERIAEVKQEVNANFGGKHKNKKASEIA